MRGPSARTALAVLAALAALAVLLASCGGATSPAAPSPLATSPLPSTAGSSAPVAPSRTGTAIGEASGLDLEQLRSALLGPSPVPAEWEAQVEELMLTIEAAADEMRLPEVEGLTSEQAACAAWAPLVGKTHWANDALLARHFFIAHVGLLSQVAPAEISDDASEALRIASAGAAEQLEPEGDPDVIRRAPDTEIEHIGMWALEHCELPVVAEPDPGSAESWTDEEIQQSCDLDRRLLEEAQEEFRAGPGQGRYAEHPHELELTLEFYVHPAWHQLAEVDNDAAPPSFRVAPFRGAFCDL